MARRLALNGLFIAMAMVLSVVERWVPLTALIPIPGVKLGLANIVTLFLLFYASWTDAAAVSILRCLLTALMFGGMSSLLFSLGGALLALPAMMLARTGYPRWFSVIGISVAGAVGHNLGQLGMAALTMKSLAVFSYLPVLLGAALLMGTLTALVAGSFFPAMERTGLVGRKEIGKAGRD
jgi:heptaprenyl diphosphate synthase